MRGLNKALIIGNVGSVDLRSTQSGTAVCNISVATNESYKDDSGEWVERAEWHRVVAWGRLAEICGEYLQKGTQVYFEGSLQTRKWEDKEGVEKYTTEIKAREMMLLGGRGDSSRTNVSANEGTTLAHKKAERKQAPKAEENEFAFDPDGDAKLPF